MSSLTLVTCLFDLKKRQESPRERGMERYLEWGRDVLALDIPMVIFCDPELEEEISSIRNTLSPNTQTKLIALPLESLPRFSERLSLVEKCTLPPNRNVSKDVPTWLCMGYSKPGMMATVAESNPFQTSHVAFIDFGVKHAGVDLSDAPRCFENPSNKVKLHQLRCFDKRDTEASDYYHWIRGLVAAGYMVGKNENVIEFAREFNDEVDRMISTDNVAVDEEVLAFLLARNPSKYEKSYGDYTQLLRNHLDFQEVGNIDWQIQDARARGRSSSDLRAWRFKGDGSLICLCMIVKDEVHNLKATLDSCIPHVDSWCICDTGSTDGTQALILEVMQSLPGTLHEEPFVDFSTNRNSCLEKAGTQSVFTLMLDSDEILNNGENLREFLEDHRNSSDPQDEAYLFCRRDSLDHSSLYNARVLRSSCGWRYYGAVHELPCKGDIIPNIQIPNAFVEFQRHPISGEASSKRHKRDRLLLEKDLQDNPNNSRAMFYLGQTLECLGELEEAKKAFLNRAQMFGWPEEAYEALYRYAYLSSRTGSSWEEVQQLYLNAFSLKPSRAEPIYKIAHYYHKKDNHPLAYIFATLADSIPKPTGDYRLLDNDIYDWKAAAIGSQHAFYVGAYQKGKAMADKVVKAKNDTLSKYNRAYYSPSVHQLFGGTTKPIRIEVPAPYKASSPSVAIHPSYTHRRSAVLRTVNYIIKDGCYYWPEGDNSIRTVNYWVDFDKNWNVIGSSPIHDLTNRETTDFPCGGFEDCRLLYGYGGKPYLSCTVADMHKTSDGDGMREMALVSLDNNHDAVDVEVLSGPWSSLHQKNWMPCPSAWGGIEWIYSTSPFAKVQHGGHSKEGSPRGELLFTGDDPLSQGHLRGGSQAVKIGKGQWLWIVHEVAWSPDWKSRIYSHRFVLGTASGPTGMTEPFYFKHRGIEFCAGLALDGETLVVSYSVNDNDASLSLLSLQSVLQQIQPLV